MMKLKGKLTISRIQGGDEENCIRIEIRDEDSRCVATRVSLSLEGLSSAMLGQAYIPCEFEFNDSGTVGMQAETKEEMVPIPETRPSNDTDWISKALKPFEIDGWKARYGDITNGHRTERSKHGSLLQRVVFFRHVPKPTVK